MATTAPAYENETINPGGIEISLTEDGDYEQVQGNARSNSIKVVQTDFDMVYSTNQGDFYARSGNDKFYQVKKVDFSLTDPNAMAILTSYNLEDEVTSSINERISNAVTMGDTQATATLYIPVN